MEFPIGTLQDAQVQEFIIAPRATCISCDSFSGPKFTLSSLRGLSDLHRRNIIPEGSERVLAESNISYAKSEGIQLEKEITRLQQIVEALQLRREALRQFEIQERTLLSPIRKLPTELFHRIFLEAQPRTHWIDCGDPHTIIQVITQVSSYWRSAAHSCAPLWARFNTCVPYHDHSVGGFVEKCILLSKDTPLGVYLANRCLTSDLDDSSIKAIAENAYRWEYFMVCNGNLLDAIIANIPNDMILSHLKKLYIQHIDTNHSFSFHPTPALEHIKVEDIDSPNVQIMFQWVPSLTHVDIKRAVNPLDIFGDLPWSQITHCTLEANKFYQDELYNILQSMTNLLHLSIGGPMGTTQSILLPHLEKLVFNEISVSRTHRYEALNVLITPSLRTLYLNTPFNRVSVVEFLQRSKCSLEELTLGVMEISDIWHIPELKTVKKLHWDPRHFLSDGLKLLASPDHAEGWTIFPMLETLVIKSTTYPVKELANELVDMLKSRLRHKLAQISETMESGTLGVLTEDMTTLNRVDITINDKYLDNDQATILREFLQSDEVKLSGAVIRIVGCHNKAFLSCSV
ncbi:hypothetical protein BDQ17DRAFT_1355621 [Cyathus striatus]|nr:hypothetical protein BDQ17DRAFT_1355621 [Cyathus striatus]